MTIALLFWIIVLLSLLGVGYTHRARWQDGIPFGLLWILVLILGWAVFGQPVHS